MALKFAALDPHAIYDSNASIASSVFSVLRNAIITLKLLPGNSLSEAEVAKQLGVSRQPVREAFIQLAKMGMLKIVPQKGSFVAKISETDVQNARFIREAIETAVVKRACSVATTADIDKLYQLIRQQEEAAAALDQEKLLLLDDAYHQAVAASADCLYGWHIVENLKAQMDRVRFLSLPEATPIATIISQHRMIVDAIQAGDQEDAAESMRIHLSEILNSLPRLAVEHQEMFSNGTGF